MDIEGTDYSVNAVPDSVLRGLPTTIGLTELAQERQVEDLDEKHCSDGTGRQLDTFLRTDQRAISMTMDDADVITENVCAAGKLEIVKSRQSVDRNAESPADVLFTNIGLFSHVKQGDVVEGSERNFLSEYCDGNSTDWKSKCSRRISLEKIVNMNKAPNNRKEKHGILNTVDNKLEKQRGEKKKKLQKKHCSGFPKRSSQEVVARIVAKMRATRTWSGVKKCAEKYCLHLEKPAYTQWCQLGHKEGLKSDTEIAIFLLRLYQNSTEDDKCQRQCSQCQGPFKTACTTCFITSQKDLKKDDSDSKTAHADMLPVEGTPSVTSESDQGRAKFKLLERKCKASSQHGETSEVHEPLSASNVWADTAYQTEDNGCLTDASGPRPTVRCGSSRNNRLAVYSRRVILNPASRSVDGAKGSTSLQVMEASPGETENVSFTAASGLLDSLSNYSAEQHGESCVQGSKYEVPEVESDVQTDVESEEALMADLEQAPDTERQSMTPKSKEKWACSVCAKTFLSSDSFRKHRRTHVDPRPYRCGQCMASFSQSGSLSRHVRLHERETPSARDKPFKCSFCGTTFTQASSLRRHMRVRAGAKACKGRRYQVRLSKTLGEGSAAAASAAGGKVYNCDQCWKQLSSAGNLKTHLKTHSSERPHACTLCPAAFKLAGSLKSHMKTHTDQRPFMCELCGARTKRSSDLALHMRTHSEERPFRCQQCQTPFKRSCDLLFHARTAHSSHKPFKCQECDAAFKRPVDLAVHKRKHTGERPFVCEQCGAAFAQSSNLSLHLRSHSDDKPFQCQECGAEFKLPGHLRRHLKTHGGEIACKQCGITFTSTYGLSIHMKRHKAD